MIEKSGGKGSWEPLALLVESAASGPVEVEYRDLFAPPVPEGLRATYMPDAVRAAFRTAPELIPEEGSPPGFDIT